MYLVVRRWSDSIGFMSLSWSGLQSWDPQRSCDLTSEIYNLFLVGTLFVEQNVRRSRPSQWRNYIEANEAAASVEIRLVGAWLDAA